MKNNRGIALIALVITILILLILAGVTVASLTGENGLLERAANARDEKKRAELIENIKLDILNNEIDIKIGNQDQLRGVLEKYFTDVSDLNSELTAKDEYGGFNVSIDEIIEGKDPESKMYTVTLNPNGGVVDQTTKIVTNGNNYGTLPIPTKEGYTFKGWTNTIFNESDIINATNWKANQVVNVTKTSDYVEVIYNQNTSTPGYIYRNISTMFEEGKTYTVSAYVKGVNTNRLGVALCGNNNRGQYTISTDEFTKVSATITTNVINQDFILLYQATPTIGTGFQIKWLQIQEGENATDYEVDETTNVTQTINHTLVADWMLNN